MPAPHRVARLQALGSRGPEKNIGWSREEFFRFWRGGTHPRGWQSKSAWATVSASAAVEDDFRRSVDYELVFHRAVGSIPSCLRQS
jgi:hypothetical protein